MHDSAVRFAEASIGAQAHGKFNSTHSGGPAARNERDGSEAQPQPGKIAMIVFGCAIAGGIIYAGLKLGSDLATTHYPTAWPYVLLGIALLIALGF
jgi:hypothetical protein